MTRIERGESEIDAWRTACEQQIAAFGGDDVALSEMRRIAAKLLDEHRARTAESAARLPPAPRVRGK